MSLTPSLAQWVQGSGVAAAAARIQSLAQELPYTTAGVAIKNELICLKIHTITKTWKDPKCPSTDEWTKNM